MIVTHTIQETRDQLTEIRRSGKTIGFVPTMGALHEGHLSLMRIAHQNADFVVASVFVNPTQFAPHEDFDAYPRTLESDLEKCQEENVDLVFAPEKADMYQENSSVHLVESSLSQTLCGASRPHFFGGVCTVVAKLFNIVQPDSAVFGEKDFQQLAIIRRMVRDLDFPIRILGGPIVREPDGIAMSSRNKNLSSEHRQQAVVLNQALQKVKDAMRVGETNMAILESHVRNHIASAPDAEIDYVELVDPETLEELDVIQNNVLIAVAVNFGTTRLIDNILICPNAS